MRKIDWSKTFNTLSKTIGKYSPALLMGVGIVGMAAATVMAVKATPKALEDIAEEKEKLEKDELTPKETIKATWKNYIPALAVEATSIICLIGANSIYVKRTAAIATAYKLTEKKLTEYKAKVVETVGEKKEQFIRDEVAKEKIRHDPVTNGEVIMTDGGNTLCYDGCFGRYFRSSYDQIRNAIADLNMDLVRDMFVSLNEFYDMLGLQPIGAGDYIGWNIDDGTVNVNISSQIASDGTPCLVIDYDVSPKYDFRSLS